MGTSGVANLGADEGVLRANLQSCSSIDTSASNGVLHVLEFVDAGGSEGVEESGLPNERRDFEGGGGGGGGGKEGGSSGVLVPDVLELTYAFGFHKMYEAIVAAPDVAAAVTAAADGRMDAVARGAESRVTGLHDHGETTVAEALRGSAAHTLLAVRDSLMDGASSRATSGRLLEGGRLSMDTLR